MKYSLWSLMIVAILGPPLLAGAWFVWKSIPVRDPEPPRIPYGGTAATKSPHILPKYPSYDGRGGARIMLKAEREGRTLETIGN